MSNLLSIWSRLDLRKRIVVTVATLGVFGALLAMSSLSGRSDMALLYAGVEGRDAAEMMTALDASGATYEVRGDAIYVEAGRRDQLRLALAGQGLPSGGGAGYELLDGLSGFGTTSQMFDAAYWRAKEGELARTILANPQVRAVRVHIARAPDRPFQPDAAPTASVTVTTATGNLSQTAAQAIRHLVAASVVGLRPGSVSVIDSVGGLIIDGEASAQDSPDPSNRENELRDKVTRLLEARVGPGKAIVQVSAELVTEREVISERLFDPKGRVAISSETEERSETGGGAGAAATVASNLPEGDTGGGEGGQNSASETRERTNYEVSETNREVLRVPGAIKRLTVAVLVDGVTVTAADGTVTKEPRDSAELAVLRELVASAVGLNESRGDTLALQSLGFEQLNDAGEMVTTSSWGVLDGLNVTTLVLAILMTVTALVLGLFVLRPALLGRAALPASPDAPGALPALAGLPDPPEANPALTGPVSEGEILPSLAEMDAAGNGDDPMVRLRRLIEERQSESLQILRGWLETTEEEPG